MKYILGSGVVGLLARFILGDSWQVVPYGRSRFYSFNPPLDDNHITQDDDLDEVMAELGYMPVPVWYKRAYSVGGQLLSRDPDGQLCRGWLQKLFGADPPMHAEPYISSRIGQFVYNDVYTNRLYENLVNRYSSELKAGSARGVVTEIGDHYLVWGDKKLDFERVVTTIPANALLKVMGLPCDLRYATMHYLHMATGHLDFEGASQTFVVDPMFSFYKVSLLSPPGPDGPARYLFHCHQEIENPGAYFMPIIQDYDLLSGTRVREALPLGDMPNWSWLEQRDIFPVGTYAQHDWCADVGSNMLRLVRYANRGGKPKPVVTLGKPSSAAGRR